MTARFVDSFDHYRDLGQKYDAYQNAEIQAGVGRFGTDGCAMSAATTRFLRKDFTSQNGWVIGMAYQRTALGTGGDIFSLCIDTNESSRLLGLRLNADSTLSATSSGSVIFTTTRTLAQDTWYYLEFKGIIDTTSGTASLHVNGNPWNEVTGVATSTSGSLVASIYIRGEGAPFIDDLYICDTSGSRNNDYWGNTRIESIYPASDGSFYQWIPSSGSAGWSMIDETPPSLTDYISSGSLNTKSSFLMTAPSGGVGTAYAIQQNYLAAKDDVALRQTRPFVLSGSTYNGTTRTMTTTPVYYSQILESDPSGSQWTDTTVQTAEFGVEVIA